MNICLHHCNCDPSHCFWLTKTANLQIWISIYKTPTPRFIIQTHMLDHIIKTDTTFLSRSMSSSITCGRVGNVVLLYINNCCSQIFIKYTTLWITSHCVPTTYVKCAHVFVWLQSWPVTAFDNPEEYWYKSLDLYLFWWLILVNSHLFWCLMAATCVWIVRSYFWW